MKNLYLLDSSLTLRMTQIVVSVISSNRKLTQYRHREQSVAIYKTQIKWIASLRSQRRYLEQCVNRQRHYFIILLSDIMNISEAKIIEQTVDFVKKMLQNAEGGHDRWHIYRVRTSAKTIYTHESQNKKINQLVVELGALLHDIADSKFHGGDEYIGGIVASKFLSDIGVDPDIIEQVKLIIDHISFKGGKEVQIYRSIELDIVQDADRLDALGAIGIARTFSFGGFKSRKIYNPSIKPNLNMTKDEYKKSVSPSINHFYEKLLLLKDRMNTDYGRVMAQARHEYMLGYLEQFYKERDGEL